MLSRFRVIDSTGCAHRFSKLMPHTITHKDIHSEKSERFTTATFHPMEIKKLQITNEPTLGSAGHFTKTTQQKQHNKMF